MLSSEFLKIPLSSITQAEPEPNALPGLARLGLSPSSLSLCLLSPDEEGETDWRTYRRPDEKSGGHCVGWSPIIPHLFSVPQDWEEVPVSIADLGGTEIDLRFGSSKERSLSVIVAPVLRFSNEDLGDNGTLERIRPPEKVITATAAGNCLYLKRIADSFRAV